MHFVYLGQDLPGYAKSSIYLAKEFSGLDVHLIGNQTQKNKIKKLNIGFTSVEDFYKTDDFEAASRNILSPSVYRDGFWLKTMERFFVLEQYMNFHHKSSIFHAELDQLLFKVNLLIHNLESTNESGLFFPFHTTKRAMASIFYCNNAEALKSLINFAKESDPVSNEMELLANWSSSFPKFSKRLPTAINYVSEASQDSGVKVLNLNIVNGIVDAAQLGQWIAGIDPKNVPITSKPSTQFVDKFEKNLLSKKDLKKLYFNFDVENGLLTTRYDKKEPIIVFNIHLHSKIHNWIKKVGINEFINLANSVSPVFLLTSRIAQIKSAFKFGLLKSLLSVNSWTTLIQLKFNLFFQLRPSSYPYISGDSFRKIADHVWEKDNKKIQLNSIRDGDVVFCESHFFEELKHHVLSKISKNITLILGNSDFNFTNEVNLRDLNLNKVKIFTQNLVDPVPEISPIPIGLENRWRSRHGKINSFRFRRILKKNKINKIMWTFSVDTNFSERSEAIRSLMRTKIAIKLPQLSPQGHRKALSKFSFVASPPGNGVDTHRTWEALYLGCVPIVLRSTMADKFVEIGLPIWIVDSYDELIHLSEQDLKLKYKELENRFGSRALWMDYWTKCIKVGELIT